ncbi:transporter substrate-binding domain-containing protein [Psychromonas aquimarina]|uniref:transporter substrate-binding domain-containing protein n=1 Tax=Psychromonas aquimarina TaxID=444919 RepID=UPI0004234302|nr:transporter substrate-binding domain-containing protein [Psychromonas aquimarina]
MKNIIILFLLLALKANFSLAKNNEIVLWNKTAADSGIIWDTLYRALEITKDDYGEYQLITSTAMEQDRALRELANSRIDLAHFIATEKREQQATAVRIPILQGLYGYRLCLIKEGNQEKFTGISSKQQWIEKNITISQHHNWPDTKILESNGITVKTTFKRDLLFQQLSMNRFDCFARGINEINSELSNHPSLGLAIEKNIVIHYPFPLFFFVNPKKPLLAERLQLGLTRLNRSGVTELLFEFYFLELINELDLKDRKFIELQNPTLSQQTINALKAPSTRFKTKYFPDSKNKN